MVRDKKATSRVAEPYVVPFFQMKQHWGGVCFAITLLNRSSLTVLKIAWSVGARK